MSSMAAAQEEQTAASCTPGLLQLSDPLPSSLSRLGLTFTNITAPTFATAETEATHTTNTSPPPSAAARPSPSFTVNAIHYDDVAEDAVLTCEGCITLFVPLHCDAVENPARHGASSSPSSHTQEGRERGAGTAPVTGASTGLSSSHDHPQRQQTSAVPAVAACLRLGNPHQAWMTDANTDAAPSPSSSSRRYSAVSQVVSERCYPRRLPLPPAALRRASSVLVAVPVLALPSSEPSAAAASASSSGSATSLREPRTVLSIVIVECAVLPEGVDLIAPADVPVAYPLRKIVCAPNSLRFREAWYPLQLCSWCGPQETLRVHNHSRRRASAKATSRSAGERGEGREKERAAGRAYSDYHLLCVSSICVDLLRIRRYTSSDAIDDDHHDGEAEEGGSTIRGHGYGGHAPDITTMMNSGHVVRHAPSASSSSSAAAAAASSPTPTPSPITTAAASSVAPEVTVLVMHRYVTHTDWCTYDPRSRVLLSLNFARPAVVKPLAVHYEEVRDDAAQGAPDAHRSGRHPAPSAVAMHESARDVRLSLAKWSELTLPESLCASLQLHLSDASTPAALPHDERLDLLLPCVVGSFTAYGLSFFYHVSSTAHRMHQQLCMYIYLYLPHETVGGSVDGEHGGSPTTSPTTSAPTHGVDAGGTPGSFFMRWAVAASSASAAAAPPEMRGGTHILVATLSLAELVASSSSSPSSAVASPLRSAAHRERSSAAAGSAVVEGPHPIAVQVCDNTILLVHHIPSGTTAAFDLAERSASVLAAAAVTMRGDGSVTTRDFLLWATASERSRQWARQHRGALTSAAASPSTAAPGSRTSGGGLRAASGRPSTGSAQHTLTGTASFGSVGQGDAAWRRAASEAGWASMVSAVAGSVLDLSNTVGTITGEAGAADAHLAPTTPLCCCCATVQAEGRSAAAAALIVEQEVVTYTACLWPRSSRAPLVVDRRDGALRMCRLDYAALAEWLLLLHTSEASEEAAAVVATAASVGALVAFACRHPISTRCAEAEWVSVLNRLTLQLVWGEEWSRCRNAAPAAASSHSSASYADVVQRYVFASAEGTTSGAALRLAYWSAILEALTMEAEFMDRCAGVDHQRVLAPARSAHHTESASVNSSSSNCARGGMGVQERIAALIWIPLWRDLKDQLAVGPINDDKDEDDNSGGGGGDESSTPLLPHMRQGLSHQRRRCEELLRAHVRLLHRLSIPVMPAMQELLLEVVLRCDLEAGTLLMEEEEEEEEGHNGGGSAEARVSIASFMRAVGRTARRVRGLLREGVVEANESTARSLLGWWERYRYQLAAFQQQQQRPDAAALVELDDEDDDSAAADWVFHEAVRLFEQRGHLLEVAEAHRWRRNFTAAAAVLLRVPCDVLPVEVWEVRGAQRQRRRCSSRSSSHTSSSSIITASTTTASAAAAAAVVAPQRTSRLLTWDTLAVAVLDGAWTAVREAEEGCYIVAEKAAAAARSSPVTAFPTSPAGAFTAAVHTAPPAWQLRAAERAVQAAHRVYLSVATTLLTAPGIPAAAAAAVTSSESTTEFHPSASEASAVGLRSAHTRFNPVSSGVSTGYYVHEGRYQQLRQRVEMDWHDMRSGGES